MTDAGDTALLIGDPNPANGTKILRKTIYGKTAVVIIMNKDLLILGIETSCDETACSVVKNGRAVLSNVVSSQIDIHKRYGGVVPEIASRNHVKDIDFVCGEALKTAAVSIKDIDAVAVSYGAGLLGALLVGVSFAKSLSQAQNLPLIKVNHIEGHICSNYLSYPDLKPPFVCLLASGGHTAVVLVDGYTTYKVLNCTVDDACGEAFDKVARTMGLEYPGGAKLDKLAQNGQNTLNFKSVVLNNGNFSYSGLKTAVLNYLNGQKQKGLPINEADVAMSFESAAIDGPVESALSQTKMHNLKSICVAGGVGANSHLRERITKRGKEEGVKVYLPELRFCGDNAAMIASRGYFSFVSNKDVADLTLNAVPTLRLQ
jgi:N6-L-threonylcarbamoyladenine synthase